MKKWLKRILVYSAIALTVRLLSEAFVTTWFHAVHEYILLALLLVMLFHFGKVIQNKLVRKKYFIYISIVIGQGIIYQLLSTIYFEHISNLSWPETVAFNVALITLIIMLFDIAGTLNKTNEKASTTLYIIAILATIVLLPVNVMFLA